jgi:simple sugar transport system permease protein
VSTVARFRRNTRWLLSRLVDVSVVERLLIALAAVVLALLVATVILVAMGFDASLFMYSLLYGAIGTPGQIAFTLRKTTMLVLTGVAVALAFRANVFNIGVQGQMVVGAFTAAMTVLGLTPYLPANGLGGFVLVVAGLLTGIVGGGAYGLIPGLMKAYADANEVITTIMLNFIATGVLFALVDGPLKAPDAAAPKTANFPAYARFPSLFTDSTSFSVIGLGIALLTAIVVYVVMTNTRFGYDLRTTGYQALVSAFSGVDSKRTIVNTMTVSGMIAGLSGGIYVVMIAGFFQDPGVFPTFGFDAIAVSLLGANNPLGVIPAGLLFGGLAAAGQYVDINSNVPKELVSGIIGLVVLFVATPELFRMSLQRLDWRNDE